MGDSPEQKARRDVELFRSAPVSGATEDASYHQTVTELGNAAVNARNVAESFPKGSVAAEIWQKATVRAEEAQEKAARE